MACAGREGELIVIPCRRSSEFMKIESRVVEQFGSSPPVENGLARPPCRPFSRSLLIFSIAGERGEKGSDKGDDGGRCVPGWCRRDARVDGRKFITGIQPFFRPLPRARILLTRRDE